MADSAAPVVSSSLPDAPDVVREAVATGTFGVVALVVLLLLLFELERLRITGAAAKRVKAVTACVVPLLVIFVVVAGIRIAELLD